MKVFPGFPLFAVALALSASPLWAKDFVRGTLKKSGDGYAILTQGQELRIVTNEAIAKSLPSLESPGFMSQGNGQKYAFEFEGDIQGFEFKLDKTPVNVPGTHALTGVLVFEQSSNSFSINGEAVRFGYSKLANGYQFDSLSKKSFVGKEVIAEGYMEDGVLVMQALTPVGLLSASVPDAAPAYIQQKIDAKGIKHFLEKDVILDDISRADESFRLVVAEGKNSEVNVGDSALIVTLSGRQGDTFGSVNGHMVAGLGVVKDDMSLAGEVSNAYVTNDKDILSGNTSLTNYFSHTVQGQNVYRPTYTLIAYGVDAAKLKKFRDSLEESHIRFRSSKLDITPQFNCTTETVKALYDAGIKGQYSQLDNSLVRILTSPMRLFGETGRTLNYSLGNDASRFQPRPAYDSFTRALLDKKFQEEHGIKRVDFVFYAQIPSARPVGGIALGKVLKALKFKKLYDKHEVDPKTKLTPEQLRPLLERELTKIPFM